MNRNDEGEGAQVVFVKAAIEELEAAYAKWTPIDAQTRRGLWLILGRIHVESAVVDRSEEARRALVEAASNDPAIKGRRFDAENAPVQEVFVALLTKIDEKTKSAKSRWTKALMRAKQLAPLTIDGFADWVKAEGGLTKAGKEPPKKKAADENAGLESERPPFSMSKFVTWVGDATADAERIDLPIADEEEHDGLTVLLVARVGWGQERRVVAKIGEKSVVASVAMAFAKDRRDNMPAEDKLAHMRRVALWTVNKVTLQLADRLSEKVTNEDVEAFHKAVITLRNLDYVEKRLFDGPAHEKIHKDMVNDFFSLHVLHPEFDVLDPGRFISTARRGALIPYSTTGDVRAAISAYVCANRNTWIYLDRPPAEHASGSLNEGAADQLAITFQPGAGSALSGDEADGSGGPEDEGAAGPLAEPDGETGTEAAFDAEGGASAADEEAQGESDCEADNEADEDEEAEEDRSDEGADEETDDDDGLPEDLVATVDRLTADRSYDLAEPD